MTEQKETPNSSSSSSESSEEVVTRIFEAVERRTLQELKDDKVVLTPEQADRYSRILRAWYSRYLEEYAILECKVDEDWLKLREGAKTDGYCNRLINTTDDGKRLKLLKARLKYIPKLIRGLDGYLNGLREEWWQSKRA